MLSKEFAVEIAVTTAVYFVLCTATRMYEDRKYRRNGERLADEHTARSTPAK